MRKVGVLIVLLVLLAGPSLIAAQSSPTLNELATDMGLDSWHVACCEGTNIGVIAPWYPDTTDANVQFIDESQRTRAGQIQNTETNSRLSRAIATLHHFAPGARVYYYVMIEPTPENYAFAVDEFLDHDVSVIAHLPGFPYLSPAAQSEITKLIDDTITKHGIVWLNAAGNYGQGYYETVALSDGETGSGGSHAFAPGDFSLEMWLSPDAHRYDENAILVDWLTPSERIADDNLQPRIRLGVFRPRWDICPDDLSDGSVIEYLEPSFTETDALYPFMDTTLVQRYHFEDDDELLCLFITDLNTDGHHLAPVAFRIMATNAHFQIVSTPNTFSAIPAPNITEKSLTVGALEPDGTVSAETSISANEGKPDLYTYGRVVVDDQEEHGTAFATMIAAGIAATLLVNNPDTPFGSEQDLLLSYVSEEGFLTSMPPKDSSGGKCDRECIIKWVALALATVLLVSAIVVTAGRMGISRQNRKKIFISYRRGEADTPTAQLIGGKIRRIFNVFVDIEKIDTGEDWRRVLDQELQESDALLALITPNWHDQIERLHEDDDMVCYEIGEALKLGIIVIPILVNGTDLPAKSNLPDALNDLGRREAGVVRLDTLERDVQAVIERLEILLGVSRRLSR